MCSCRKGGPELAVRAEAKFVDLGGGSSGFEQALYGALAVVKLLGRRCETAITDLFEQEPKLNAEYAAVVAALLDYTNKGTPTGNGDAPLPPDVASAWKRAGLTRSWDKPWG